MKLNKETFSIVLNGVWKEVEGKRRWGLFK
jgi:hypothetical protein